MAKQIFIEKLNKYVHLLNNPIPSKHLKCIHSFDQIREHNKDISNLFEVINEIDCHLKNVNNIQTFKIYIDRVFDKVYSYIDLLSACRYILMILEYPHRYNLSVSNIQSLSCACYK